MPMINIQKYFLESVNRNLKHVVEIAAVDFVAVNTMLKEYYTRAKSDSSLPAYSNVASRMEAMMGDLQYMDVFNQRVEHLILTHERMMTTSMAKDFEESFFHLHVFQSMTIELDLIRSINSIKDILFEIKDYLGHHGQDERFIEKCFAQTEVITNILQGTVSALTQAGGEIRHLSIPVLTEEQIKILSSLYTMESERLVLSWFLNHMPNGTWEQLLQYYENAIDQVTEENTELF